MPIFSYFAIVGAVLVALFFLADATLEKGTPPVVTSERQGLPEPWRPDPIQTLVAAPAPEPDMTSQAVLAAQPKSAAEVLIHPRRTASPASNCRTTTTDRASLGREIEIAFRSAVTDSSSLADSELFAISFLLFAVLFGAIYKVLPETSLFTLRALSYSSPSFLNNHVKCNRVRFWHKADMAFCAANVRF